MVEGEGVEKMMGEGDGEEKDTALLLNLIVKGGGGLGCSTAAADSSGWSAYYGGGDSGTGVHGAEGGVCSNARSALGSFVSGFRGSVCSNGTLDSSARMLSALSSRRLKRRWR